VIPTVLDFDQSRAVALGLDASDLVFLAWFSRWANTGTMAEIYINGAHVYWLKYSTVLAQLPILRLSSPDALARRLRKMAAAQVLVHGTHGGRSYYGFGDAFAVLCGMDTPTQKSEEPKAPTQKSEDEPESSDPKVGHTSGFGEDRNSRIGKAVAGATARKVVSPYRAFSDLFVARGGPWANGVAEGVSLSRLVIWAKKTEPARWEEYLRAVMDGAWELVQGRVAGLPTKDKEWWTRQPYTPSSLLSLAKRVVATLSARLQPPDADAIVEAMFAGVKQ